MKVCAQSGTEGSENVSPHSNSSRNDYHEPWECFQVEFHVSKYYSCKEASESAY